MMDVLKLLIPIVVAHVVALIAIIIVVKKLLLNDTMKAVDRIRQVEAEVRRKEEGIRKEIAQHEEEFERKKAAAEAELHKQREDAEKEVGLMREATLAEAKKDGERILENAKKNEANLRQQIAQSMEEKAVEYGGQVFQLVFSDVMNAELNKCFIGELLDALEEIDGSSITVDVNDASFSSSHPMDAGQKARLEGLLADKFGATIKVEETVNEELLGGLVFKLGSLEIDGSLLNRFKEAAIEVKKNAHV